MDAYSITIKPTYQKENGVSVLHSSDIPLPEQFTQHEMSSVLLPSGTFGGNHSHPRQEAFFCYQHGVQLHWIDQSGKKRVENFLDKKGNVLLWVVPPHTPHAVINNSDNTATLIEYADGPQIDVRPESVLD